MAEEDKCQDCENDVKKDEKIECFGPCKNIFHLKCAAISPRDYKTLKGIEGCKWFCNNCRHYLDFLCQISKEFHDFKELMLAELRVVKTNNAINSKGNSEEVVPGISKTYAHALKGEAIVIKPKAKQKSSKTMEVITQKLNPCEMEVGVTQIKDVKDGGILIKCKTKNEIEKLKNEAEKNLGNQYKVSVPEKKNPCIKIVDFEEDMSNEKLVESIRKQNDFLRNEEEVHLKVLVNKKMVTRYMAILECDPTTHGKILQEGSLSIGWIPSCRVFDYVQMYRCYNCGGFGHGAKECKCDTICSKCCATDHVREECTSEAFKCRNCEEANNKMKLNLDLGHSMYDVNKCTVYQRQFYVQKQKTKIKP